MYYYNIYFLNIYLNLIKMSYIWPIVNTFLLSFTVISGRFQSFTSWLFLVCPVSLVVNELEKLPTHCTAHTLQIKCGTCSHGQDFNNSFISFYPFLMTLCLCHFSLVFIFCQHTFNFCYALHDRPLCIDQNPQMTIMYDCIITPLDQISLFLK